MPKINSHLQYLIKSFEQSFVKGQQWVDSIQLVVNEHLLERQQTKSIDNLPAWYPKKYLKNIPKPDNRKMKWSVWHIHKELWFQADFIEQLWILFALRQHTTCLRKINVLFISFLNITQTLASRNHQLEMVQVKGVGLRNFPDVFGIFSGFLEAGKTTTQEKPGKPPVHGIQVQFIDFSLQDEIEFVNILDFKLRDKCLKTINESFFLFMSSKLNFDELVSKKGVSKCEATHILIPIFDLLYMILEASNHR